MENLEKQIAGEITLSKNPGAAMKKWREIFGVTQTELANYLKITPSTISDYESNRRKSPGINVVKRFIESLIEIDTRKGGWILKKMQGVKEDSVYKVEEFSNPINANKVVEAINGKIATNKKKLKETELLGYTIVDSLKAILELPVDNFAEIYGPTPNRAVIFTGVDTGRSPMVAIRITKLKPSVVIYPGLEKLIDPIAKKISEVEKIPIVLTNMSINEIKTKLSILD